MICKQRLVRTYFFQDELSPKQYGSRIKKFRYETKYNLEDITDDNATIEKCENIFQKQQHAEYFNFEISFYWSTCNSKSLLELQTCKKHEPYLKNDGSYNYRYH